MSAQVVIIQGRKKWISLTSDWLLKSLCALIGYSGVTVRVEINQAREMVWVLPLIGRKIACSL